MSHTTLRDPLLWQAIAEHPIGGPNATKSFVKRLARENCLTIDGAEAAILEYRRFCYLQCLSPTGLTPSHAVDQVWHLHLLHTRDYWQHFCAKVLGRELHHIPSVESAADGALFREQYAQTLAQYEREFGLPDAQWWPSLIDTFAASNWQWHNKLEQPRRRWFAGRVTPSLRRYLPLALLVIAALLLSLNVGAQLQAESIVAAKPSLNPLDYSGSEFLSFYLKMLFAAVVLSEVLRRVLTPKTEPGAMLSDAEIALLDGGEERAIQVLEVEQMAAGNLSYDAGTRLLKESRVGNRTAQDLANLRLMLGNSAHPLRQRLLAPLIQNLQHRGLLLDAAQRARIGWISVSPLLALMALGLAKINVGLTRNKPITFLILMLALTLILLLVQYARRPRISAGCKTWFQQQRERHKRVSAAPTQQEWGKAVALFGLTAISGTVLAEYVGWRQPVSSSSCGGSSTTSTSSSSDAGSSDSSGDSGGGCGGCGGGGGD